MQTTPTVRRSGFLRTLGPGVMYAGAAIGVSHLVQSTRAGADYGFSLIWAVILVHLFKYPFFEYAHRYTAATGENLLEGYRRIGRWALLGYMIVALGLSIPTAAVLTIVTAGMASSAFGGFAASLTSMLWAVILLALCVVILACGGFQLLDKLMKALMATLAVCTIFAVCAAIRRGPAAAPDFTAPAIWNVTGIAFLVALMGWMPTPVDASTFPSVWMQERGKQTGHKPTLREALADFHIGYVGSLVTAVMFLSLGALVMFGSGEQIAGGGDAFAMQFISMYTNALGNWSKPIITAAALITMFSTLLTVVDAYPRTLAVGCRIAWPGVIKLANAPYWIFIAVMTGGALVVFKYLTSHMRTLIDATTTLAFLSAPLFAYLNCRVVSSARLPDEATPPKWLRLLAWTGLAFLTCFSIVFLIVNFGPFD